MTQHIQKIKELTMDIAYENDGRYTTLIYELDKVKEIMEDLAKTEEPILEGR